MHSKRKCEDEDVTVEDSSDADFEEDTDGEWEDDSDDDHMSKENIWTWPLEGHPLTRSLTQCGANIKYHQESLKDSTDTNVSDEKSSSRASTSEVSSTAETKETHTTTVPLSFGLSLPAGTAQTPHPYRTLLPLGSVLSRSQTTKTSDTSTSTK